MSITVTPTHAEFFAEISGIDLARPLKPADRDAIEDAINRYAVVVFHDQKLTDDQQIDFAPPFRPDPFLGAEARGTPASSTASSATEIADISNLDGDGKVLDVNAKRRLDWLANRLWHTDASFRAIPGALSMLYAHVIPDEGGDTEFADMRAAYDALPDSDQEAARRAGRRCIRSGIRAASSTSPTTRRGARQPAAGAAARWCAPIPARDARRSISPRTPRTSSACRSPTAASC